LNSRQRQQLRAQARHGKDARIVRRAVALLELDQGRPIAQIAATLGVTRQTLYNWVARFEGEGGPSALQDRDGRGRPTVWTERVQWLLEWSMAQPPETLGYASVEWTTNLLRQHLARVAVDVSDTTLREQLHRLGYVWKRPRYVLQSDPDREKKTPNPTADPAPS
jgi:transposase